MSREIKFRAWDKETNILDDISIKGYQLFNCLDQDRYEVMQFTGLTDRQGVEIYEGDIVRISKVAEEVRWRDGAWQLDYQDLYSALEGSSRRPTSVEVIGNIYENPKLLQESEVE